MPKVSIIIPFYEVKEFVARCLDSICAQTLSDIEIICVDDCGMDGSADIVKRYAALDERIHVYTNPRNLGISAARNLGIEKSTGEYMGFVDSDDWVETDFFERLYSSAKRNGAEVAIGNVRKIIDGVYADEPTWVSLILEKIETESFSEANLKKMVSRTNVVWNKIFSRDLIMRNEIRFFEGLYFEDNPFTILAIVKAGKVCLVKDVFYNYVIRRGSVTDANATSRKVFDIFEIMKKTKESFSRKRIREIPGYEHYYLELLAYFLFSFFRGMVPESHKKEFFHRMREEFSHLDFFEREFLLKTSRDFRDFCLNQDYESFIDQERRGHAERSMQGEKELLRTILGTRYVSFIKLFNGLFPQHSKRRDRIRKMYKLLKMS